jgi:copper resistance protein B
VHFKALFDQLEWQYLHGKPGLRWDNSTWIGGDINRLWIKTEGESVNGDLDDADVRVLYGRTF